MKIVDNGMKSSIGGVIVSGFLVPLLVLVIALLPACDGGSRGTGARSVSMAVIDPNGVPLENTTVTVVAEDGTVFSQTATDADGIVVDLPVPDVGAFTLRFEKPASTPGQAPFVAEVAVTDELTGGTANINLVVEIDETNNTITATPVTPSPTAIPTSNPESSAPGSSATSQSSSSAEGGGPAPQPTATPVGSSPQATATPVSPTATPQPAPTDSGPTATPTAVPTESATATPTVQPHPCDPDSCPWDQDGNNVVNAGDRGFITANLGCMVNYSVCDACARADVDRNGTVNPADRALIDLNMGPCP